MTSASLSTSSRRQRRKQHTTSRPQSSSAGADEASSDFGFDGAGDARRLKRKNRNAMNSRSAKRRGASPFDSGATSDDNRQRKSNGAFDRKPKGIISNGKDFRSKKFAGGNARLGDNLPPYEEDKDAYPVDSETPGAMAIWNHLRNDGIFPPKWPDVTDKDAMGRLRTDRETWSQRALESLARVNLIDPPGSAPRRLDDIIHLHGLCEEMCPESEMIMRIIEPDIPSVEKDAAGIPDRRKMVKKATRSAAGEHRPLPWDVLSTAAVRRAVDYLYDDLLGFEENLPRVHGYIWDRTRALRRNFSFFTIFEKDQEMYDQVYVYETTARFHVTALHLLSRKGINSDGFSEQQELEQLGKSLMSLMTAYDMCDQKGIICENEAEFRAYHGIFFAHSPDIAQTMQAGPKAWETWKTSDIYLTAISLMELVQNTKDLHGPMKKSPSHAAAGMPSAYFRIIENSSISYTMACFAEIHFGSIRRTMLRELKKGLRRPKMLSKDPTPAVVNSFLRFDTDEEAVEFIESHGLKFVPHPDAPQDASRKYLDVSGDMDEPRIHHTFSQSLVERKRGNHSLQHVIRNTVFEGSPAAATSKSSVGEGSRFFFRGTTSKNPLHVSPTGGTFNSSAAPFSNSVAQQVATDKAGNPFDAGQPAKADNSFTSSSPSPFGTPIAANPFANSTPATVSTPQNPFSSAPAGASPFTTTSSSFGVPAPSSIGESQNDTSSFKSPFASATPGLSPFAQDKAAGSSQFSQATTVAPQQPAQPSETKAAFSASPFGTGSVPKTASPFASLTSKPSDIPTKALDSAGTTNTEGNRGSQSGSLATSQAPTPFAKPSQPQLIPPVSQQPPLLPAVPTPGAPGLAAKTTTAPTSLPTFAFTAPTPPASTGSSVFAPKALTTTTPATQPNSTGKSTFGSQEAAPHLAGALDTKSAQILEGASVQPPKAPSPAPSALAPAAKLPTAPPMAPPPPKRDLLGDFTRWFVQGDGGLLEEFQEFIIADILQKTYRQFRIDEAERLRKEEEEADLKKAREFQVYNLSVKFFYRWRNIARTLRLRRRRARDKEEYKAYMAAKQAEEMAAKQKAKRAAAKAAALEHIQKSDPVTEFRDFLQTRKESADDYETALLASGILSGVANEQQVASNIVRGDFKVPRIPDHRASRKSLPNGASARFSSPSQSTDAGGAKTRALREQLAGESSSSFRRSLPPGSTSSMSWRASSSPSEQGKRVSKVSDRWRLKAMGLVTMPDGSALPEKLANSMRYDGVRYEGWGSFGLDGNSHKRSRSTSADLNHSATVRTAFVDSFRRSSGAAKTDAADPFSPPTTKRKRTAEDEALKNGVKTKKQATAEDSIEKILREAKELRGSLRTSRMDLDETTGWFREQSGMMQQEEMLSGRSSSAWGEE